MQKQTAFPHYINIVTILQEIWWIYLPKMYLKILCGTPKVLKGTLTEKLCSAHKEKTHWGYFILVSALHLLHWSHWHWHHYGTSSQCWNRKRHLLRVCHFRCLLSMLHWDLELVDQGWGWKLQLLHCLFTQSRSVRHCPVLGHHPCRISGSK